MLPPPDPTAPAAPNRRRRILVALLAIVSLIIVAAALWIVRSRPASSSSSSLAQELKLDECDPAGYVPCEQQAVFLTVPIADTGLSLTYSSQWAPGRTDRRDWDASPLGLGGWSLDAVQRYDAHDGVLISGDGTWRIANRTPAGSGQSAVPAFNANVAYVFDGAGRHVRTVDGHFGTTLLTVMYDRTGRILRVAGSDNGAPANLTVQRGGNGVPTSLTGIDGAVTSLFVQSDGRLASVRDPAGHVTSFTYGQGGLITSATDAGGGVTRFTYDSTGRLSSETNADGITLHMTRMGSGDSITVQVTSAMNVVAMYGSQLQGSAVRRTFAAPGGATTTEMTAADGSISLSTPDGTTRTMHASPDSIWGSAAPAFMSDLETRPGGATSRTLTQLDLREQGGLPYMLAGSVAITVNGSRWVESFDPASRSSTLTDPLGRRSVDAYDTGGRLVSVAAPGTPPVQFTYDSNGRQTSETVGSGVAARTTRYAYHAQTGVVTITDPEGRMETSTSDASGNVVSSSGPDGSTVGATYNADEQLTGVQPPGDVGFTMGDSPAGRLSGYLPPAAGGNTAVQTASYDSDGNLSRITGFGSSGISYAYDSAGRIAGVTFDQGTITYAYDSSSGMPLHASDPRGISTSYGYSGSQLDKLSWSGPIHGSVAVTLDANGGIGAESVDGATPVMLEHDAAGDLTSVGQLGLTLDPSSGLTSRTSLGVVQTTEQYDANDDLVRFTSTVSGKMVLDIRYTRDPMGRITGIATTNAAGVTTSTTYTYDAAERLSSVNDNGTTVERDAYDAAGDRTSVTTPGGTTVVTYNARQQVVSWGGTSYSWAADGELAHVSGTGATAYAFDDLGRLRSVTLQGGRTITYLVDPEGRRVGREVNGNLVAGYLYDTAGRVAAETDGAGNVLAQFAYDNLGHLAIMVRGGVTYRILTDQLGSPLAVIDSQTGAVVDAITYDAWGRITGEAKPGTLPFGFAGGLADRDTGLVHFGARDYDPVVGRWTGPDPLGFGSGDANLYRYASGDPVDLQDPDGLLSRVAGDPYAYNGDWEAIAQHRINEAHQIQQTMDDAKTLEQEMNAERYNNQLAQQALQQATQPPTPPPPPTPTPPQWNCTATYLPCSDDGQICILGACAHGPNGSGCVGLECWDVPGVTKCVAGACGDDNNGWSECMGALCELGGGGGCFFAHCGGDGSSFFCAGFLCFPPNHPICGFFCTWGDTHITTGDGVHFDFQAAGEFIATISPHSSVEIQVRQELDPGETNATFATAVAADVAGDRVGVYAREPSFLMLNGTPVAGVDISARLPHGGGLERHGGSVDITWPDGSRLHIAQVVDSLSYAFAPAKGDGNSLRGLLGKSDGNATTDLTGRDGTVLTRTDPAFNTQLYKQFGDSWRISQAESLFHYWPDESTATFTNLAIPHEIVTAGTLPTAVATNAGAICRALGIVLEPILDDCILDVGITGNPAYAAADADVAAAGPQPATPGSSGPMSSNAGSVAPGGTITGNIESGKQREDYTLAASTGQVVYLRAAQPCVQSLFWNLLRPDGSVQSSNGGCGDIGRQALTSPGTYTIEVGSDGTATGAYMFTVLSVPATTTQTITVGQTISGSVSQIGAWHDYTFVATAGEVVALTAHGQAAPGACASFLQWRLLRPDGTQQAFNGVCGDMGRQVLNQPGTWTIEVYSDTISTGPYAFAVSATQ